MVKKREAMTDPVVRLVELLRAEVRSCHPHISLWHLPSRATNIPCAKGTRSNAPRCLAPSLAARTRLIAAYPRGTCLATGCLPPLPVSFLLHQNSCLLKLTHECRRGRVQRTGTLARFTHKRYILLIESHPLTVRRRRAQSIFLRFRPKTTTPTITMK